MSPARRRAAAAVVLGVVAGASAVAILPAQAGGVFDGRWTSSWGAGLVDGMTFSGDAVILTGTFTYEESRDGAAVTDVDLVIAGNDTATCPDVELSVHAGDGDNGPVTTPGPPEVDPDPTATTAPPTTPDTSPPTTPDTSPPTTVGSSANTFQFGFSASPACNGIYDIQVTATADPAGLADRDVTNGEDEILRLEDVRIGLRPPNVASVTAIVNPDTSVSVGWAVPAGYDAAAAAAPGDFLGYAVQRADRDGAYQNVVNVEPSVTNWIDRTLPPGVAGIFRYRVFAVRYGATVGTFTFGDPATAPVAQISIAGPPPPPTTTGGGSGGTTRPPGRTTSGVPVAAGPTTIVDEGFDNTLPFEDLITGPEDAVLPEDAAGLFEVDTPEPGSGLLVPFAIAMVLLVWSMHLRHLSRRAATPA